MKKIFFVMAIMTVFTTVARDRLYIENFSIAQGETLTIPVQLDNDTAYCAFQTDLYLPQGMQVEVTLDDEYETYNIYLTSRKTPYHRISTALLPDGAIRIAVTAYPVFPFSGNSGPIATIELTATEELSNAVVALRNSIMVEESGQMHYLDDCEATVNAAAAPVLVTGISLNKTETELYLNETETLTATVTPDDADNKVLNWTSSDPTVATVDQNGVVTALAVGTATITATTTDGSNLSASCAVTVKQQSLQGDVNGDGEVDVRDITALIDVIMNSITDNPRADVNQDGDIDVRDITALIDIIMNS
ncbi:MAG: Ig-like domain-containing protein [Muribaculaceae bacterium]|nr:Ig-like domain-containing protein [Muribaculaceae bacterium]